jgi:hypothetical protein
VSTQAYKRQAVDLLMNTTSPVPTILGTQIEAPKITEVAQQLNTFRSEQFTFQPIAITSFAAPKLTFDDLAIKVPSLRAIEPVKMVSDYLNTPTVSLPVKQNLQREIAFKTFDLASETQLANVISDMKLPNVDAVAASSAIKQAISMPNVRSFDDLANTISSSLQPVIKSMDLVKFDQAAKITIPDVSTQAYKRQAVDFLMQAPRVQIENILVKQNKTPREAFEGARQVEDIRIKTKPQGELHVVKAQLIGLDQEAASKLPSVPKQVQNVLGNRVVSSPTAIPEYKGGIDFNPADFSIEVKGEGLRITYLDTTFDIQNLEGFTFQILNITNI